MGLRLEGRGLALLGRLGLHHWDQPWADQTRRRLFPSVSTGADNLPAPRPRPRGAPISHHLWDHYCLMLPECPNLSSNKLAVGNNHLHEGASPGSREGKNDQDDDFNRDNQVAKL